MVVTLKLVFNIADYIIGKDFISTEAQKDIPAEGERSYMQHLEGDVIKGTNQNYCNPFEVGWRNL